MMGVLVSTYPAAPVLFPPVFQKVVPQHHPVGVKKRHARRLVVKAEQVHGDADFPVVALFGLFEEMQVSFRSFLSKKAVP